MVNVADASVVIRGDLSKFEKDVKKAGKEAETLGQRFEKALTPKNIIAGAGIGLASAQIVSFLGDATQAAAEFSDSVSATGVIFGSEAIPPMEEWAEKAAAAFGSSKQDALAAANGIAVFGKSAGLAGQDLISFSTELTQLGGDLASMFGGSTEEAIGAVGSALRGEFEPIRRYGVLLDDATLRQQAFEMGLISTTKNALTPQQRVLAAQAAIFAQTSDAQGDFARTSDGMMNTQRTLAAELENVSIEIGEEMLPIMVTLARFAVKDLIPAFRAFVDYLKTAGKNVGQFVDGVSDYITTAQIRFGDLGADIEKHAKEAGYDVAEFKDHVIEGMTEMNLSLKEAEEYAADRMDGIPRVMTDAARRSLAAWKQADLGGQIAAERPAVDEAAATMSGGIAGEVSAAIDAAAAQVVRLPGDVAVELQAGKITVDTAAKELAGLIPASMVSNVLAAVETVRGMPAEIAAAILDGRDAVVTAATGLATAATDPLVNEQRIAETRAALADMATMTAEEIKAATPESEKAREAELAKLEIMLAGYMLRSDPQSKEAMGLLAKYAESEDAATQEAYDAMLSAVEERAFIMERDVEQKSAAAAEALPAALARERARAAQEAYVHFLGTVPPAQRMKDDVSDLSSETARATREALDAEKVRTGIAAESVALRVRSPLAQLKDDAYWWGRNINTELGKGLGYFGVGSASQASVALAHMIRGPIRIDSEPAYGPLTGITTWGGNMVKTIADGMLGELGTGANAARALAGALVPSLGMPAMGMAGGGMAGGTKVYQLYTDGERVEFDSKRAMVDYLEQIGETWG